MDAYCSRCGEKRRDRDDWKLSSIAGETFAEITNLEHSKLLQTFRLLVFKPGQLTREYWNGRRKSFLGPVKLYFVLFALTLILYSIHRPTAVYDVRTLAAADPRGNVPKVFDRLANERAVSMEQIVQELNSRWQSYLSLSQPAYPLFVALALKLLLRRRTLYFAEHLIFALHTLAFMLFSFAVTWPLFPLLGIQPSQEPFSPVYLLVTIAWLIWMTAYVVLALRRAYGEGWLAALVKGAIVLITYFAASFFFMFVTLGLAIALTRRGG